MTGFGGQQPGRNTPQLGSGRPTNGRATGPQGAWPFGVQNGAPGLPPASRTPLGGTSFAQSLAGNQPSNAPLDPSDFPSLSNTSSSAFPNPSSQAVWSTGRPHARPIGNNSAGMGQTISEYLGGGRGHQAGAESLVGEPDEPDGNGGSARADGDRDRTVGSGDHLGADGSGQPGWSPPAIEEFPPLGGLGSSDLGQDRRVNMMQNAANNGVSSKSQSQDDLLDQASSPTSEGVSLENNTQPDGGASGEGNGTSSRNTGRDPLMDQYGMPELLTRLRSLDPTVQALAIGHDLTAMGMDLSSNEPLWPTWSGPFGTQPARPLTPEFQLPACYKVNNVRSLHEKISGFNSETLFIIFYQMPGDIAQELAAYELTNRNWRYHKVHKFWFTRLNTNPVPLANSEGERGVFEVFNFPFMRRESRQMYIKYADVDDHIEPVGPFNPMIT